jgi:2-succinyl-5-enolpyruvyl-6-hydroxy-3-cyclohexene-1-carboxylate synthase
MEVDDSKLIQMLKNKVREMKIPLHQLHKKDKLSTVMEESQSQSGRTVYEIKTPRDEEGGRK